MADKAAPRESLGVSDFSSEEEDVSSEDELKAGSMPYTVALIGGIRSSLELDLTSELDELAADEPGSLEEPGSTEELVSGVTTGDTELSLQPTQQKDAAAKNILATNF